MAWEISNWPVTYAAMLLLAVPLASAGGGGALEGCSARCGNVDIPYPFGIGEKCSVGEGFQVACTHNKPYLIGYEIPTIRYEIHNISLDSTTIRISTVMPPLCNSKQTYWAVWTTVNFWPSPTETVFTVVGCNVLGLLNEYTYPSRTMGCISTCLPAERGRAQLVETGACNGVGCCQTSIGENPWDYQMWVKKIDSAEINNVSDVTECYRAFMVEKGWYKFAGVERVDPQVNGTYPLVLEWSVGRKETCEEAVKNSTTYACRAANSVCRKARLSGYLCQCSQGYEGNAYLPNGCKGKTSS